MCIYKNFLHLLAVILFFLLVLSGCASGAIPSQSITPSTTPPNIQPSPSPTSTPSEKEGPTETETITPVDPSSTPTTESSPTVEPTQELTTPVDSDPAATSTTVPTSTPSTTDKALSADCENMAGFYGDVTIPDYTAMNPGETFTKTWRVRNEGNCAWDGYSLFFAGGSPLGSPYEVVIPQIIAPEEIVNVSIEMSAPPQAGPFTSYWKFKSTDGEEFGVNANKNGLMWVTISVRQATPVPGSSETTTTSSGSQDTIQSSPSTDATCQTKRSTDYEVTLLTLINNARAQNGLDKLTLQPQLTAAALVHSNDMACNDFVDHIGSDGSSWAGRVKAQDYSYSRATENIYVGNPAFGGTAEGAFDWWMNSTVHRDNILDYRVTEIGIAYVYYDSSTYGGYYTLVLAHP